MVLLQAEMFFFQKKAVFRVEFHCSGAILVEPVRCGKVAERLKATVSKIVVRFICTGGSNPPLSAIFFAQIAEFCYSGRNM